MYLVPITDNHSLQIDSRDDITKLEDEFISYMCGIHQEEQNKETIISKYLYLFEYNKGIPSLDDVSTEIHDYNWEIVYRMAEIQYVQDCWSCPTEESKYEVIQMLADGWYEFYYYDYFRELDMYVAEVLSEYNMSFYYDNGHVIYEAFTHTCDDLVIIANDAQNFIFPELFDEINVEIKNYFDNTECLTFHSKGDSCV